MYRLFLYSKYKNPVHPLRISETMMEKVVFLTEMFSETGFTPSQSRQAFGEQKLPVKGDVSP